MTIPILRLSRSFTPDGGRENTQAIEQWIASAAPLLNGALQATNGTIDWSVLVNTPTTLAGYGITSPLGIAEGGTNAPDEATARQNLSAARVTISAGPPDRKPTEDLELWIDTASHILWWGEGNGISPWQGVTATTTVSP